MKNTYYTTVFPLDENGGNPCPVTLNADNLSHEQMQQLTKELGFESVFIQNSSDPSCSFRLCYFVPEHEMEMCVHATIAATTVLFHNGLIEAGMVYFQTILGRIKVNCQPDANGLLVEVWQFLPTSQESAPGVEELSKCLGISDSDLLPCPPQSISTSRFKLLIPVKDQQTLDHIAPDFTMLKALCEKYHTTGFYPFCKTQGSTGACFHARQFPANSGYPEDAATGVAASALGVYLLQNGLSERLEGWNEQTIYQGEAMNRPSKILSRVHIDGDKICEVSICGYAMLYPASPSAFRALP